MLKYMSISFGALGFLAFCAATLGAAPANPKVLMKTNKGDITIELYQDKAPISVKNFLAYVDEKFFDNTVIHRVSRGFVLQGGGYTVEYHRKNPKAPIKNEAANGLSNKRYTLSMARPGEIDGATSQFFINLKDNFELDHKINTPEGFGYAVFGAVVSGMEIVDAIGNLPIMSKMGQREAPRENVIILSASRIVT